MIIICIYKTRKFNVDKTCDNGQNVGRTSRWAKELRRRPASMTIFSSRGISRGTKKKKTLRKKFKSKEQKNYFITEDSRFAGGVPEANNSQLFVSNMD